MPAIEFDFSKKLGSKRIVEFAEIVKGIQSQINFKVSSRGWCYLMEQAGYINKSQFDKIDVNINRCRKNGLLPVDFVAEEDSRAFKGVEVPTTETGRDVEDILKWMVTDVKDGAKYYTPDWWDGEKYYIQMLVEKIDLKTLFEPVCRKYHIPIANAKGWSSILQRAEYARRFKEAEDKGLKCVLLYCGDHDPDGLRISDTIRNNLHQLTDVRWTDGEWGYDPTNLEIKRFGLNYQFIIDNNYTWIDNLITGSGMNLADVSHKNNDMEYVQEYIKTVGVRKCEANAIVTTPDIAEALVTQEIESWLGNGALERFRLKREVVAKEYEELLQQSGLKSGINYFLGEEDEEEDDDE